MSGVHRIVRQESGGVEEPSNDDLRRESVGPAAPESEVVKDSNK